MYFHIDTDGYGTYLLLSQEGPAESGSYDLFVSLATETSHRTHHYTAKLLSFEDPSLQKGVALDFSKTTSVPDVSAMPVMKKNDWPQRTGGFSPMPGPPAFMRQQADETAIYFYHKRR